MTSIARRKFLAGTAATALVATGSKEAAASADPASDEFTFEVTRTEDEWREMLDPIEYFVLRDRGTEGPFTGPYWESDEVGTYSCKGCGLTIYDSLQKVFPGKGWTFFRHARPSTTMLGMDIGRRGDPNDPFAQMQATMEAHCRRCGSHLGHIVAIPEVPRRAIHCINGFALNFEPSAA